MAKKLTDLQKFLSVFQTDKYKILKGGKGAEIRAMDLDGQKKLAQSIIDSNKLNLKIVSNGQMAVYRAFEVWEGK